ncbi:hypothetical protein HII36_43415 [Nonomuraea sp. NN258]|uniref:hypothetical protein n=1 Tax=Nonomuraea antri TaxID=2730852 RepID=UPI00156A209C|nr:hypothetical protein [Nonomuraea antri]NRQ38627.1 hypothetical protein [Nonomuraea antri]
MVAVLGAIGSLLIVFVLISLALVLISVVVLIALALMARSTAEWRTLRARLARMRQAARHGPGAADPEAVQGTADPEDVPSAADPEPVRGVADPEAAPGVADVSADESGDAGRGSGDGETAVAGRSVVARRLAAALPPARRLWRALQRLPESRHGGPAAPPPAARGRNPGRRSDSPLWRPR